MQKGPMGAEFWNGFFQWGSVALIAVTFFFGAGALWTGNRINDRQAERLVVLETELASAKTALAEQQERAAKAEIQLAEIRKRQEPRHLAHRAFVEALKGKPTGEATVWHSSDDGEAYLFALAIQMALMDAGWTVLTNSGPIPDNAVRSDLQGLSPDQLRKIPNLMRVGGQPTGVSVVTREMPSPSSDGRAPTIASALLDAMLKGGFGVGFSQEPSMPDTRVLILVGPKP